MNGQEKTVGAEIALAKKEGANMLIPTTEIRGLSQFHIPVVDSVYLSSKKEDGDVYPEKAGEDAKLRITAQGLRKLAVAAGISWHTAGCKRTDNRSDRDYVSYQAVGSIKKNDGTAVAWKGEFDIDLQIIEEELKDLHTNKSKSWRKTQKEKDAYVEASVRRDLIQKRKHKVKLAETGAMNRVIRAILGLRSSYTVKELSKPFVVLRIVFQPDFSDPETKRQITAAAISSMTGVYGAPPLPTIDIPTEDYQTCEVDGAVPDDGHEETSAAPATTEDKPQDEAVAEKDKPATKEMLLKIFNGLPDRAQVEELTAMAAKKGYDLGLLPTSLAEMDIRNKLRFFTHLSALKDAAPVTEDDIPF